MIGLNVDLIVTRGTPAALAAKKATSTIPVVMASLGEPLLVVASLARPGANLTGLSGVVSDLDAKRKEILKEMAPATSAIAAFLNTPSLLRNTGCRRSMAGASSSRPAG